MAANLSCIGTALFIYAHPDDESFVSGTPMKLAAAGHTIALLTLTRGDARLSVPRAWRSPRREAALLQRDAVSRRRAGSVRGDDADARHRRVSVRGTQGRGVRVPQDAAQGPRLLLRPLEAPRGQGVLPP